MRIVALCLLGICLVAGLWAQPPLEGRWLFEGVSDSGKKVPLFILEFTGGTPPAKLVSSTAPFELVLQNLTVDADKITIVFLADRSQLTLTGTIEQGLIKGKAVGDTLSGLGFRAQPTEQTELKAVAQPSGQELDDYETARQSDDPSKRLELLRSFLNKYPQSPLKTSALSDMLASSLEAGTSEADLLKLIDETVASSVDKAVVQSDIAFALAEEGKLLEKAEELVEMALASAEPETGAQANFLDTLGWVLYRQGKLEPAIQKLREAVRISPRRPAFALHLAEVLTAANRQEQATEAYVQAFIGGHRPAGNKARDLYVKIHGSDAGYHDLIDRAYAKLPPLFDAGRYEGSLTGPGVVAELFTGAQCGPCQASDYAFDGLLEHFPEQVLTVLEYHVHIPAPDPLANPDSLARARFYKIRSSPIAVFGGTDKRSGGGPMNRAERVFREFLPVVTEQAGRGETLRIDLKVTTAKDQLNLSGKVSGIRLTPEQAAEKVDLRLFLALVEKTVHYTGANGVHLHRNVVRKLLNGVEGTPITEKELRFHYEGAITAIETALKQYLDGLSKEWEMSFDDAPVILDRSQLAVAAFVQNVASGEILGTKILDATPGSR